VAAGVTRASAVALRAESIATPLGELTIVCSAEGVVATIFEDEDTDLGVAMARIDGTSGPSPPGSRGRERSVASAARREIRDYFAGRTRRFSVRPDLRLVGEGFGRRVLEAVTTIPYGELWTYGDVAGMAGSPHAARAAGSALASCPIELFVPCHRVVHAGGTIGGYGRHEDRKRWLLRHEGATA
jgi:methylated-DNA-[protein]-cysteine S-methyltransferase